MSSVAPRSSRNQAGGTVTSFPLRAVTISPSNSIIHSQGIQVFVNGAGDVRVEPFYGGNTVTFTVEPGQLIPVVCRRVLSTGTTATGLIGLY